MTFFYLLTWLARAEIFFCFLCYYAIWVWPLKSYLASNCQDPIVLSAILLLGYSITPPTAQPTIIMFTKDKVTNTPLYSENQANKERLFNSTFLMLFSLSHQDYWKIGQNLLIYILSWSWVNMYFVSTIMKPESINI